MKKTAKGCCLFVAIILILIVVGIGGVAYLVVKPKVAGDFFVNRISPKTEDDLGIALRDDLLKHHPPDEEKSLILNKFFKQLNYEKKVRIYVVKGDEINALALPGNHIIVFEGLLNEIESYPELAAVLSHEYAHIESRHTIRTIATILVSEFQLALFFNGDQQSTNTAKELNQLRTLKYSRDFEIEADIKALKHLEQEKINPNGMIDLYSRLGKIENQYGIQSTYLSDHPLMIDRIDILRDSVDARPYTHIINKPLDDLFLSLSVENVVSGIVNDEQ